MGKQWKFESPLQERKNSRFTRKSASFDHTSREPAKRIMCLRFDLFFFLSLTKTLSFCYFMAAVVAFLSFSSTSILVVAIRSNRAFNK